MVVIGIIFIAKNINFILRLLQERGYAIISKEASVNYNIFLQQVGNITYMSQKSLNQDFSYTSWLTGKFSPLTKNVTAFLNAMLENGIYAKVWIQIILVKYSYFLYQSTFLINQLSLSINFIHWSIFIVNQPSFQDILSYFLFLR